MSNQVGGGYLEQAPRWTYLKSGQDLRESSHMENVIKANIRAKVSYFFISREKFNFVQFLEKNELVSKNAVFYFFPCRKKKNSFLIWVSQCVSNFSRKKKKTKH